MSSIARMGRLHVLLPLLCWEGQRSEQVAWGQARVCNKLGWHYLVLLSWLHQLNPGIGLDAGMNIHLGVP